MCKGKTTILATHAVDFFPLADKIILLDKGELEGFGSLEELKSNKMMAQILKDHDESRQKTLAAAKAKKNEQAEQPALVKKQTSSIKKQVSMQLKKQLS